MKRWMVLSVISSPVVIEKNREASDLSLYNSFLFRVTLILESMHLTILHSTQCFAGINK